MCHEIKPNNHRNLHRGNVYTWGTAKAHTEYYSFQSWFSFCCPFCLDVILSFHYHPSIWSFSTKTEFRILFYNTLVLNVHFSLTTWIHLFTLLPPTQGLFIVQNLVYLFYTHIKNNEELCTKTGINMKIFWMVQVAENPIRQFAWAQTRIQKCNCFWNQKA